LRWYLETGNKKRKGVTPDAGASAQASRINCQPDGISGAVTSKWSKGSGGPAGDEHYNMITQPVSHWEGGDVHPTLNQSAKGSGGVGSSNQELFSQGGAYLVPGEAMPFRKSKRACSTTDNETWVPADASNTLNNFDLGDTRTTHAVVEPMAFSAKDNGADATIGISPTLRSQNSVEGNQNSSWSIAVVQPQVYENHPNDSRVTGPLDVAPTVVSRFGTGGGNVPLVNNEAITFQPGNLRREAGADPSSTTTTTTLKASAGDQTPHVATPMAVRRLTPVECERLQGFPDNWSRISWKGKPETECPDGPRYKACGNSMAVPVMRWIGERIAAVDSTISSNA
jgi:DNA (cytosine-5)-methyltransferase 1